MTRSVRTLVVLSLPALALGGCDDVRIGSPDSLWLLWLVPALVAFYVYAFRKKTVLLRRFASPEMLERLMSGVSRPRQYLKAVLVVIGLLATLLALAEIRWGFTWEEVQRRGVDIVVALDVSDSMLVEDAESGGRLSRLERAKREITDLLRLMEGDRIGLVAFAGTAFVECPLTLDYGAAEIFLDTIDTDLIPVKGTSLGDAIRTSLAAFEGGSHPSRAVILITDGEDHTGDALRAAAEAKLADVRIFTIGIGRDEGAPIPALGGGFRRDRSGEIILSRLDEPTLQKIALDTGGKYVRSVTGDVDLEQIYSQGIKATLEDQELGSKRRQRWEERFQWLLAVALVALMLETLISDRVRRRRRATAVGVAVTLSLLAAPSSLPAQVDPNQIDPAQVSPVQASPAQAPTPAVDPAAVAERFDNPYEAYESGAWSKALEGFTDYQVERPEDPEVAFNLGSVHYRMRNYAEADKAFSIAALAADESLRGQALYNLGNSAFRQGKLQDAVELYKAALDIDPDDADAKFNLEYVRDEIRRRVEEQKKRQEEQQEQSQQEQQGEEGEQDPGEQEEQQEGGEPEQQEPSEPQAAGPDSDQDGLPDATEQTGENPTDPSNPDSDGDGLADGQEDLNRNGRVDPGETDPNREDSDGDGIPDAQEAEAQAQREAAEAGELPPSEELTQEEAERYLQAIQEGRPDQRRGKPGRQARPLKDW